MGPPKEGTLNFVKPPSQEVTGLGVEILVGMAFTFLGACFIAPEVFGSISVTLRYPSSDLNESRIEIGQSCEALAALAGPQRGGKEVM